MNQLSNSPDREGYRRATLVQIRGPGIDGLERRANERTLSPFSAPARFVAAEAPARDGMCRDFSTGGVFLTIRSRQLPDVGTRLPLRIAPGDLPALHAIVEVTRRDSEGLAARFVDISSVTLARLILWARRCSDLAAVCGAIGPGSSWRVAHFDQLTPQ